MKLTLLPEGIARRDGTGAGIALASHRGKPLLLKLGITQSTEQESLEIAIWGSPDQKNWRRLHTFPQKFYCGNYGLMLDLGAHPEIAFLRAEWKMNRWGRGDGPLFAFYLIAEEPALQAAGAA